MKYIEEWIVKNYIEQEIKSGKYNLKQKQDLGLMLNALQSHRINLYNHIILIILAFILGYMLSVQMQNDMYKVMNNQIEQCNQK